MASQVDELLLRVRTIAEGQKVILDQAAAMETIARKGVALNQQQAAVARQTAAAVQTIAPAAVQGARAVDEMQGKIAALAPRVALLNQVFEFGAHLAEEFTRELFGLRAVLEEGAGTEKLTAQFNVLLGSQDKALDRLHEIDEFTARAPFGREEIRQAGVELEALGVHGQRALQTVANTAAFTGKEIGTVQQALVLAGEGMFRGLARLGINVDDVFARLHIKQEQRSNLTVAQSHAVVEEILRTWETRYAGGIEKLAETTTGRFTIIQNRFHAFLDTIAESGVGRVVADDLGLILARLDELEKNGSLERWARGASDAFTGALSAGQEFVTFLVRFRQEIVFAAGAGGMLLLISRFGPAIDGLVAMAAAGRLTVASLVGLVNPVTAIAVVLGGLAAISFEGAAGEIERLRKHADDLNADLGRGARLSVHVDQVGLAQGIAEARAHIDELVARKNNIRFDAEIGPLEEQLRRARADLDALTHQASEARRAGPAGAVVESGSLPRVLADLDRAQAQLRTLNEQQRKLSQDSPLSLIDPAAARQIRDLITQINELKAARDRLGGTGGREAPFTGPVAQVTQARQQLGDLFGQRFGEGFGDFQKRLEEQSKGLATAHPTKEEVAAAAELTKEELARRLQIAHEGLQRIGEAEKELTDRVVAEVQRRLDATGAEGAERVRLRQQFTAEELSQIRQGGDIAVRLQAELEARLADERSRIRTSGATGETLKQLEKEQSIREEQARKALAFAIQSGQTLAAAQRQLELDLAKDREKAETEERARRTAHLIADAQFERDLFGQTSEQYVAGLRARLAEERRAGEERVANLRAQGASAARIAQVEGETAATVIAYEKEIGDAADKSAHDREKSTYALVTFERDQHRQTTEQYLAELRTRGTSFKAGVQEALELTDRLTTAEAVLRAEMARVNAEAERLGRVGVSPQKAVETAKVGVVAEDVIRAQTALPGLRPDEAASVAATKAVLEKINKERAAQFIESQAFIEAAFADSLTRMAGLNAEKFSEMTATQRAEFEIMAGIGAGAFAAMSAAGKKAYDLMTVAAASWFRHHKTTHGLALEIVRESAKAAAAAELERISITLAGLAKEYAIKAAGDIAAAIEFPPLAGQFLAAAAKYTAAALLAGGAAAVTAGAAANLGRDQETDKDRTTGQFDTGSAADRGVAQDKRVTISQGNAPITQNFYLSINYQGGLNLFGPEAGRALVNDIIPALQDAIDNKQLRTT